MLEGPVGTAVAAGATTTVGTTVVGTPVMGREGLGARGRSLALGATAGPAASPIGIGLRIGTPLAALALGSDAAGSHAVLTPTRGPSGLEAEATEDGAIVSRMVGRTGKGCRRGSGTISFRTTGGCPASTGGFAEGLLGAASASSLFTSAPTLRMEATEAPSSAFTT